MCNNCNCENYDKCSIVGHMPIGFCCSKCVLYNEEHTCLKTKTNKLSKKTVDMYRINIMRKYDLNSMNDLIRFAVKYFDPLGNLKEH